MRFNASTTLEKNSKWRELMYLLVLVKKTPDISELIEDSDAENTKRQIKYVVSRMYLKKYDISCLIIKTVLRKAITYFGITSNSLFW